MSSSLLIILLVIVWLFVLAPMLIRSRNPIRRTGDALAQTRTLYSGGSGRLVPRARRVPSEPADPATDEALFGLPSGEGSTDCELLDVDAWAETLEETIRLENSGRRGEALREALAGRRPGIAHSGGCDESTTEIPVVTAPVAAESRGSTRWTARVADESEAADSRGERVAAAAGPEGFLEYPGDAEEGRRDGYADRDDEVGHDGRDEDFAETGRDAHEDSIVLDGEVVERTPEDAQETVDAALIDAEAELAHRGRRRHAEPVELTEEDLDFAERRRGRGAYDPMADRAAAEDRFRRRRRTAGSLLAIAVLAVIAALLLSPTLWWVAGVAAVALVGYLTYLRRQVLLEESLRRRRIERMRRARLGVESRQDDELSVVPPRLRRPGAVVLEVDDEDPAFDHLDHDRLVAAEEAEPLPEHRPLRRAVG